MSKIKVRDFVAQQAGATLPDKMSAAASALFPATMDFPENMTQAEFIKKLLTRFYNYEFCREEEELDFWSMEATGKIDNLLEKYKPLYESLLIQFDPILNVQTTSTQTGTKTGSNTLTGSDSKTFSEEGQRSESRTTLGDDSETTSNNKTTSEDNTLSGTGTHTSQEEESASDSKGVTSDTTEKHADTPQGALNGVSNGTYMSAADLSHTQSTETNTHTGGKGTTESTTENKTETKRGGEADTGSRSGSSSEMVNGQDSDQKSGISTGTRSETGSTSESTSGSNIFTGYQGISASKLLMEYRETLVDITDDFIADCSLLFNLCFRVDL